MLTEHPPGTRAPPNAPNPWVDRILVPEMWGTVAIAVMWLAVLFVGVFGPNIVVNNTSGYSNWPVVVVVALFALFGTVAVARHAYRPRRD